MRGTISTININQVIFCFVRISSDVWTDMQTIVEDGCTSSKCFKGANADIFTSVQPLLNFTFTVKRNGIAGSKLENGSWTGQIGKKFKILISEILF